MIYSSLYLEDSQLRPMPASILKALAFLKETDLKNTAPGRVDIDGDDIYALVQEIETKEVCDKRPESHKDYLDIQYIVCGEEKMGYANFVGDYEAVDFNTANDIYFYKEAANENFVICRDGDFCIFFPWDIHRPGCCITAPAPVKKVVVKVRMSTF